MIKKSVLVEMLKEAEKARDRYRNDCGIKNEIIKGKDIIIESLEVNISKNVEVNGFKLDNLLNRIDDKIDECAHNQSVYNKRGIIQRFVDWMVLRIHQ